MADYYELDIGGRSVTHNWNHRLRSAYVKSGREPDRPVRLPADDTIQITGDADHAVINMAPSAIVGNMQENGSAFEGWSLALKYWRGADVTLRWVTPLPDLDPKIARKNERHYQRFLYRVERFRQLFPWFNVDESNGPESGIQPDGNSHYLNVAGNIAKPRTRPTNKQLPENELENRLLTDNEFDRHYGFSPASIKDRQFPIGLFSTPVPTNASMVFPGGKGAIDLVCLDVRRFWIFELKAKSNIPIGTVSELLFYSSVIRDAVIGKFKFSTAVGNRARVMPDMIANVEEITAVMLGHDLHPLLSDPGVFKLLNEAVASRWNSVTRAPKITFRAGQIMQDDPLKIEDRG